MVLRRKPSRPIYRGTARSRDSIQPSGESTVTPDWLLIRPNTQRKARGKPIEEMMPDICTGC
jgi:hypothetical protein